MILILEHKYKPKLINFTTQNLNNCLMQIHNLTKKNSILNTFISELRDVNVQKDRMRFRRNIERVGEVLGYELSKVLNYTPSDVKTPLGKSRVNLPQNDIVICSILRAGVPLHNGLLNYFDNSENVFISNNPDSKQVWLIDPDNLRFYRLNSKSGVYTPKYGAPELVQGKSG